MKQFVLKTAIFSCLAFLMLVASLLFIPNDRVKGHMLMALVDKHILLDKSETPKLIFAGGSSVAYSLNSQRIQDSIHMPVVNAGLNAGLGMKFYLEDIKPYIKEGDIVVVAPEYIQYHTDWFYGNTDLVSTIFDVHRGVANNISASQWIRLVQYMPFYAASKVLSLIRQPAPIAKNDPYGRYAFNENGDAFLHWDLPGKKIKIAPKSKETDKVNPEAIALLEDLNEYISNKKARMIILPPVFQSSSFENQELIIRKIYQAIREKNLPIIATPERYRLPDSVFYDSDYHLIRAGVEMRSSLVIEDLKKAIANDGFMSKSGEE